jgi:tRNA threonylcarbamoyladenosine biosynthesis protein TsaB
MMADGFTCQANPAYSTGLVCPMIDARRLEVFTAVFNRDLGTVVPVSAKIIDEESFKDLLSSNEVVFIGDGAPKCSDVLKGDNAIFSDLNFNSAANMSKLAERAYTAGGFEDLAYFEPFYLKDFVLTIPKKK